MVRSGWGAGPGDPHSSCNFDGFSNGFVTTSAPKKNKKATLSAAATVQDAQRKTPKPVCREVAMALQDWRNDCMNKTLLCRLLEKHGLSSEAVEWQPKPTLKTLSAVKKQLDAKSNKNNSSSGSSGHDGKPVLQGQVKTKNCMYAPGCEKHSNMKQAVRAVLVDGASITELTAKRFETSARTLRAYLAIAREGWTTKEGAVKAAQIGIFYAERAPLDISQDADVQAAVAAYLVNDAVYSAQHATSNPNNGSSCSQLK